MGQSLVDVLRYRALSARISYDNGYGNVFALKIGDSLAEITHF